MVAGTRPVSETAIAEDYAMKLPWRPTLMPQKATMAAHTYAEDIGASQA